MKSNVVMLIVLGAYFLVSGVVYIIWNHLAGQEFEATGSVGLLLSAVLAGFVAFFLNMVNRSQGGILLPEDSPNADIDDADPDLGHFSPWSWWPLILGAAIGLVFLGLAVGFWIIFLAIPLVLIAVTGWTYEYYRGNFGH
ncbi:cytochrome c oxidase subunit 4 [Aurantimicrobium sp. MWH-Uga1]|uniref:cytochrome c oxidase subunit 4 n=1 Tax=Aurantimicrobium sp. MWH-Uga1 TaxID=2079575 RepID=UPI000DEDD4C7|nr:cytochrome c oxidase subunit 4 [Aurantimicrobium sp. MWH-Uga1]AXE54501.1 Cytochrome c oxidase polypeptide 4 [Aurantimicrobium sp. MWH-Uga1]